MNTRKKIPHITIIKKKVMCSNHINKLGANAFTSRFTGMYSFIFIKNVYILKLLFLVES